LAILGLDTFCRETVDKELVANCFRSPEGDITYLTWLLQGWGTAVALAMLALVVAMGFGILMGILRTTPHKGLVLLGDAWTELFRNIPLIVQLFLWYFALPELIPALKLVPGFVLAFIGLGLFTSSRISEQVKAGITALPRGQRYAGLAMGLTLAQTYRYVLLPVALRIVIPPLTSEAMGIVKNSAVAFAVSVPELIMFARQAQEETSRGIEVYLAVTGLYFVSSIAVFALARFIELRVRVPGMVGSSQ
jgi:glutamate/aspartate transport system permease protein